MRRSARTTLVAAATAMLLAVVAGLAWADDTIFPDGDTGVASPNLSYGSGHRDCSTRGTAVAGDITVSYNGNSQGSTHHYTPGESLSVTLTPPTGSGISAAVNGSTPNVPTTWGSTQQDSFVIPINTTVPTSLADGNYKVEVTVVGNSSGYEAGAGAGSGRPHYNVQVACTTATPPPNQPPTVEAGGPYTGNEGSDIALNGGSATDSDGTIVSNTWSIQSSSVSPGACSLSNATSLAGATIKCTDNGTATVQLSATDDDGATSTDTASVTISNVAPLASGGSFGVNPFNGLASAGFSFSDAGTADTHTATFSWNGIDRNGTVTETNGAGTASDSQTLTPGCYTLTVTGKVTDDDGADSNVLTLANAQQFSVYSVRFLPPITDGERNIAKYGNVVPVKVSVTDPCNANASVTTASLYVSYYQGVGDDVDSTPVVVAESVSNADGTSGQMRRADGFYIFNFATKPLSAGKDYTIRIWKDAIGKANGGTFLIDAVLRPKK